jgi:CHAD domain-containing protein
MTFHIRRHEPLAAGLRRIAREQVCRVLADSADSQCPLDEKIHSLRARCKKLRALLQLPGPLMGGSVYRAEDSRLREAGKRLGALRDAQVRAETLAQLEEEGGARPARAIHAISLAGIDQSLQDLRETLAAIEEWPLPVEGFCDIAPGFAQTYRRCLSSLARVRDEASDEHYHELRKWTKSHWYQVRILERSNKPVLRQRREGLKRLGLLLGEAHDLSLLNSDPARSARTAVAAKARKRQARLYRHARQLAEGLFAPSVDALTADMSLWWAEWRN